MSNAMVAVEEDGSVVRCRECGEKIARGDVSAATAHAIVHRTETVEEVSDDE